MHSGSRIDLLGASSSSHVGCKYCVGVSLASYLFFKAHLSVVKISYPSLAYFARLPVQS